MRKYLKILTVASVVILLPLFAGLILWNRLPEEIPMHWNASGEVDGWCPKLFAVVGMPLIFLGGQWLGMLITLADPKKQNHPRAVLHLLLWFIPVLSVAVAALTYCTALGIGVRVEIILPVILGLLFVVLGIYMPQCKQNYTVGIKLPWTLHSEENWNRTHRLAGWVWIGGGIAMMAASFFGNVLWTLVPVLVAAIVPTVYSFILYRKGI